MKSPMKIKNHFIFSFSFVVISLFSSQAMSQPETCQPLPSQAPSSATHLEGINSPQDFSGLADKSTSSTYVKYLHDLKSDRLFFQNTSRFEFHIQFIRKHFPELSNLASADYEKMLFDPARKRFSAGALYWAPCLKLPAFPKIGAVGFHLYFKNKPNLEEIRSVHRRMQKATAATRENLVFIFDRKEDLALHQEALKRSGIESTSIETFLSLNSRPQVYNPGLSYGYLRTLSNREMSDYAYEPTDILVLDKVPLDIGPVSGVLTAEVIVPNSHVILRAINQKIPNAYLPNALSLSDIQKNLGQLVELTVTPDGTITIQNSQQLGQAELLKRADAYFKSRVPKLPPPVLDLSQTAIRPFTKPSDPRVREEEVRFYGAKGTNMGRIDQGLRSQGIPRDHFNNSFLVPFAHYAKHVGQAIEAKACGKAEKSCSKENTNHCQSLTLLCQKAVEQKIKIQDFVMEIVSGKNLPDFRTKRDVRKSALSFIRSLIKKSSLPADSEAYLVANLKQSFKPTQRIRFRSSTNAEDLPGLNGAGLYESKAGCLADEGRSDEAEGSACMTATEKKRILGMIEKLKALGADKNKDLIEEFQEDLTKKKTVSDAVRGVYASLWTDKAYLNREFYRIPHQLIHMGVLVHPSFFDEMANGVLIVKKNNQGRFEMNVVLQKDDISITNPAYPGALPEQLLIQWGAQLPNHVKVLQRSNLTSGARILSNDQIQSLIQQVQITYETLQSPTSPGQNSVLDIEFIVGPKGEVLMKQARPLNVEKSEPPPVDDELGPAIKCSGGFGMPLPPSKFQIDKDGISITAEYCIALIGTSGGKFYSMKRVTVRDQRPKRAPGERKRFVFQENQIGSEEQDNTGNRPVLQKITHHNENDSLQIQLPFATYRVQVEGDVSTGFESVLLVADRDGTNLKIKLQDGNLIIR